MSPSKTQTPQTELLKSRIRELFYLEARMPKEIVEVLIKENPLLKDEDLKKLVNNSLRDDVLSGYPDGNGGRYLRRPNGLYRMTGFGESLKPTLLTNFKVDSLTTIVTDDGQTQSEAVRVLARIRKRGFLIARRFDGESFLKAGSLVRSIS